MAYIKTREWRSLGDMNSTTKRLTSRQAQFLYCLLHFLVTSRRKMIKYNFKNIDILKHLHINTLFVDALEQMPFYVKVFKDILANKRMLNDFETIA